MNLNNKKMSREDSIKGLINREGMASNTIQYEKDAYEIENLNKVYEQDKYNLLQPHKKKYTKAKSTKKYSRIESRLKTGGKLQSKNMTIKQYL